MENNLQYFSGCYTSPAGDGDTDHSLHLVSPAPCRLQQVPGVGSPSACRPRDSGKYFHPACIAFVNEEVQGEPG